MPARNAFKLQMFRLAVKSDIPLVFIPGLNPPPFSR